MRIQFLFAFILAMIVAACNLDPSVSELESQRQSAQLQEMVRQIPAPAIKNFAEKRLLKAAYEARDDMKTLNYLYTFSEYSGKWIYIGRCFGMPMPYSTQYNSPQHMETFNIRGGYTSELTAQAEPNGIFPPASAEGTMVAIPDPKTGEPRIAYFEMRIEAFPIKIEDFVK
jgi:hypothetical protein